MTRADCPHLKWHNNGADRTGRAREACSACGKTRYTNGNKRDPNRNWHGTASGYNNHRCRCESCTAAWTKYCNVRYTLVRTKKDTCSHPHWSHHTWTKFGVQRVKCTRCFTTRNGDLRRPANV